MSQESIFQKLNADFGQSIGKLCGIDLAKEEDFVNITNTIYNFMLNLENNLMESANQSDTSTPKQYSMSEISEICTPTHINEFQLTFYDKGVISLDEILSGKNAHILTSLLLDGSGGRLSADEKQIYTNLNNLLNQHLIRNGNQNELLSILNNPQRARKALLAWNTVGATYKMALQKKICSQIINNSSNYISVNNKIYEQLAKYINQDISDDSLRRKSGGMIAEGLREASKPVSTNMSGGKGRNKSRKSKKRSKGNTGRKSRGTISHSLEHLHQIIGF